MSAHTPALPPTDDSSVHPDHPVTTTSRHKAPLRLYSANHFLNNASALKSVDISIALPLSWSPPPTLVLHLNSLVNMLGIKSLFKKTLHLFAPVNGEQSNGSYWSSSFKPGLHQLKPASTLAPSPSKILIELAKSQTSVYEKELSIDTALSQAFVFSQCASENTSIAENVPAADARQIPPSQHKGTISRPSSYITGTPSSPVTYSIF